MVQLKIPWKGRGLYSSVLHSGKLTWQWNFGPGLKMYFLLKMGIFHCYVSLLEGSLKFRDCRCKEYIVD